MGQDCFGSGPEKKNGAPNEKEGRGRARRRDFCDAECKNTRSRTGPKIG